jgi:hypothetical protein
MRTYTCSVDPLTDHQTLHDTMTVGQQHIPLTATGYGCQTGDVWRLLLAAAARRSTIESACADVSGAPDAGRSSIYASRASR